MVKKSSILEPADLEPIEAIEPSGFVNKYECIGTLGDSQGLTCSIDAVRRWGKASTIKGFETFEKAAESTKQGEISAFVVPCAYPALNTFIMDSALTTVEMFISRIPSLVLVGARSASGTVEVVFHHPATQPLLAEIGMPYKRNQPVASNVKACEAALQTPGALAITNLLSAQYYQVDPIKVLRPGIEMPWLCFKRQ